MQNVREAVLDLVANLVVANAAFTHTCLQLLVYSFLPPPSPPGQDEDQGEWKIDDDAAEVQAAVLATLEKVGAGCFRGISCDERGPLKRIQRQTDMQAAFRTMQLEFCICQIRNKNRVSHFKHLCNRTRGKGQVSPRVSFG